RASDLSILRLDSLTQVQIDEQADEVVRVYHERILQRDVDAESCRSGVDGVERGRSLRRVQETDHRSRAGDGDAVVAARRNGLQVEQIVQSAETREVNCDGILQNGQRAAG